MAAGSKTILIVEDDLFTLKLYAYHFREEGYTVAETPDATEALEMAKVHNPALFIVDIMLQDGNGFDIIRKIRKQKKWAKTPIFVLSNLGQEPDIHEAQAAGANKYFVKSNIRMQEVVEEVNKVLKK